MTKKKYGLILMLLMMCNGVFFTPLAEAKNVFGIFNKSNSKSVTDIYDLSIDENLASPDLGKQADAIADFQQKQALSLQQVNHFDVATMRNGEIIVVTIPAGQLFAPNDTALSELGKILLKPLLNYLKTPGVYKMILAMHSDNTGNEVYTLDITRGRVNAVYDWIGEGNASRLDYVVPYALGSSEAEYPNNSVANRKKNRRLEIYLVPESKMMELAKKGIINL